MNKLIYLSPERRPAPHGKYWGMEVYEHEVCCEIAAKLTLLLQRQGFTAVTGDEKKPIAERAAEANRMGADFYLAIHTNASGNGTKAGTASGTEMLAFQHPEAVRANQCIYDELTKLYPSGRGLKNGGAYLENNSTRMVSAYCEIIFHDNPKDAAWLVGHKQEAAEAMARGICRYFGAEYQEDDDSGASEQLKAEREQMKEAVRTLAKLLDMKID